MLSYTKFLKVINNVIVTVRQKAGEETAWKWDYRYKAGWIGQLFLFHIIDLKDKRTHTLHSYNYRSPHSVMAN